MKITLFKEKIYEGNLLLVNAAFAMQTKLEGALTPVAPEYQEILLKREAVNSLQFLFQEIGCEDRIVPVSGYRSAKEQKEIYEASLRDNGAEFTHQFVAAPCHSEHQTGLAIDLGLKKEVIDFICPEFPQDGICGEFRKAAPKYGFIERYPKGKEHITGIAHEPWHFRYVGYPHSEIMCRKKLTLEEYMEFVKQFSQEKPYQQLCENGREITIFYASAKKTGKTVITLAKDAVCQVSGNNVDGFIVTLWRDGNA